MKRSKYEEELIKESTNLFLGLEWVIGLLSRTHFILLHHRPDGSNLPWSREELNAMISKLQVMARTSPSRPSPRQIG
jgi:hypothetical protein